VDRIESEWPLRHRTARPRPSSPAPTAPSSRTENGDLLLLDTQSPKYAPLAERRPFNEKHPDALAPALVGDHLYLRSAKVLGCFVMGE
jgi:hypothetical protein